MIKIEYYGNKDLLQIQKTAFLASSTIPANMVLKTYDWATSMRDNGQCVISGFSSKLEKDVLQFLLKGKQPIIIVLARRMYKTMPEEWEAAFGDNRLLIISLNDYPRQGKKLATERNRYVAQCADKIFFVGVTEQSSLYPIKEEFKDKLITPTNV